ncbi:MAG: glycosyltransferase [Flavobacteriales bacterium]|nr:MAG: glycosyltransferase [Flavobacteriales bacterium]
MASSRNLLLFTMRFPYGKGEAYLENELPVLAKRFTSIAVMPLFAEGGAHRDLPANTRTEVLVNDPYKPIGVLGFLKHRTVWNELVDGIRRSAPTKEVFNRRWTSEIRPRMRQALHRAILLKKAVEQGKLNLHDAVIYSYWAYDWPIAFAFLQRMLPDVKFVTRMHGFDLYADREPDGWPAFRDLVMSHASAVHVPSLAGMEHLKATAPQHAHKLVLSRMGTTDHGMAPWAPSDAIRLVSCSNLYPLKRVDLIIAALKHIDRPVRWTHFGEGPEMDRLRAIARELPTNVSADFRGAVANADLMQWYNENPVDLFVHMSASEGGIPVALQEAASFGIPLLAADAGGVCEIVDDRCGVLLRSDPAPEEIGTAVLRCCSAPYAMDAFRKGVRERWAVDFRAEDNFARLCDHLLAAEMN